MLSSRVADPHSVDLDPIRIQGVDDQKLKKKLQLKIKIKFFWSKTAIYLSLGLHKERPSYRRSPQLSKENIHHLKTWNFLIFFYFCHSCMGNFCSPGSGSGFRMPDPDPLTDWIRIQFRSGSATLLASRSTNDGTVLYRRIAWNETDLCCPVQRRSTGATTV